MVSDIPITPGVINLEYADDITFMCSASTLSEVTQKIEEQLGKIYKWSRDWGFEMNFSKTKAMLFTRKNISSPIIKINNTEIEFVQSIRYLGMILDSPKLTWKDHIQFLVDSSISKINAMRSITRFQWGADRIILLRFYVSVIRGKMDYGAQFYGTAAFSHLKKLDTIQNKCLRIAIGAKRTSPTMSLEVESNIMPLGFHRKLISLKYYQKIIEFPSWHPLVIEINQSYQVLINHNWSNSLNSPPLQIKALKHLENLGLEFIANDQVPTISPLEPWNDYQSIFQLSFTNTPVANLSDQRAQFIFFDLVDSKYQNINQIYTDGSYLTQPEKSAAAGVVIYYLGEKIIQKFKLNKDTTILGCELYAIYKALQFICSIPGQTSPFVIFSDSLSGITCLANPNPSHHLFLVYEIHKLLQLLNSNNTPVSLQFIPGHKGLKGNEEADQAAKEAHNSELSIDILSRDDKVRIIKLAIIKQWEDQWHHLTHSLQKGLHLRSIRDKINYWPWSSHKCRAAETLLARLRIGHVNVNYYLNKIGKSPTSSCQCGATETVSHLLLDCNLYSSKRIQIKNKLLSHNIPFTLKNLLGGGDFELPIQNIIINTLVSFLSKIGRLRNL